MDRRAVPTDERSIREPDGNAAGSEAPGIRRRDFLRLTLSSGTALALDGVLDLKQVRAATAQLKLSEVSEFTTACNFCSCGCGMIAAVRDGQLLTLEGDFDHVVNGGSLCVKGMAVMPTHASPRRNRVPRYRAAGSDHWVDLTWEDAITKIAQRIKKTRDETWIATEKVGDAEVPVNRTDAFAFLGGAQNTNEENYIFQKAARLLGTAFVEHQARL
jgi:formate dehydrogenase major subunit